MESCISVHQITFRIDIKLKLVHLRSRMSQKHLGMALQQRDENVPSVWSRDGASPTCSQCFSR